MTEHARGPFEVSLVPLQAHVEGDELLGRRSIDKVFHGELEGTSQGEMLSAGTTTKGSACYVAIEKVTATLAGKKGTFVLSHLATMDRGKPSLTIAVVPDSGTGELVGLAGTLTIDIGEGGKHSYDFAYSIA